MSGSLSKLGSPSIANLSAINPPRLQTNSLQRNLPATSWQAMGSLATASSYDSTELKESRTRPERILILMPRKKWHLLTTAIKTASPT